MSTTGQIVAVHSAKGGLGTSTVAASLAAALAMAGHPGTPSQDRRVVLVDFTTSGVGLREMLNVEPRHDLSPLHARTEVIDEPFVQSLVHQHGPVALLAAVSSDVPEGLSIPIATQLLAVLRRLYDVIVIDTDRSMNEQTLAAFDAADRILIVVQPEILALRSAQQTLALCRRLGYAADTVQVILNRCTGKDLLRPRDVQRAIGQPLLATLPNGYRTCQDAIATGRFLPDHARTSALAAAFRELAARLTGKPIMEPAAYPPTALGRLFRRSVRT